MSLWDAPGMSGGPVFILKDYEWMLVGIYTGVDYPDFMAFGANDKPNDRHAALGVFCDFIVAQQHLQRS